MSQNDVEHSLFNFLDRALQKFMLLNENPKLQLPICVQYNIIILSSEGTILFHFHYQILFGAYLEIQTFPY